MSIVKSFSFPSGENRGDMFYVQHGTNNFTIIDCFLKDGDNPDCRKDEIISELEDVSNNRIRRFISTHPDNDHILGIEYLDDKFKIRNFYAVENNMPIDNSDPSLVRYDELKKKFNYEIYANRGRAFLNKEGMLRNGRKVGSSGIRFLWPYLHDPVFRKALEKVEAGQKGACVNNISPIITYQIERGGKYMWMGDMLSDMQMEFLSYYKRHGKRIPNVDVLFHPHHGRMTARINKELMKALNPKIVVIGNAPADHLDYQNSDLTITQNTAGDIIFDNQYNRIHVFTKETPQKMPNCLKKVVNHPNHDDFIYQGTVLV